MPYWGKPHEILAMGASMTLSRPNLISGFCIVIIGIILLSQTFALNDAMLSEGIHPMDYPRALIYILLVLGAIIIFKPCDSACSKPGDIPIFSFRSCTVALTLVLYALLLDYLGFALTSFLATCCAGYIMGWRRIWSLLLINFFGISIIWILFKYGLKILLPSGELF